MNAPTAAVRLPGETRCLARARRGARRRCARLASLALAALTALPAGCGGEAPVSDELLRVRAEAAWHESRHGDVLTALEPLVAREPAELEDLLRYALALFTLNRMPEAADVLERARAQAPADPRALHLHGHVLLRDGDYAAAADVFATLLEIRPQEAAAAVVLAGCLDQLGRIEEAVDWLERARATTRDSQPALWSTATYRLSTLYIRQDRIDEGLALRREKVALEAATGTKASDDAELAVQFLGAFPPPQRSGPLPAGSPAPPLATRFAPRADVPGVDLAGSARLTVADVDADGRPDLLGFGLGGLVVARRQADGGFEVQRVHTGPVADLAVGDLDPGAADPATPPPTDPLLPRSHAPLELVALTGAAPHAALTIFGLDDDGTSWSALGPGELSAAEAQCLALSDFHMLGSLDVLLGTQGGVQFLLQADSLRRSGRGLTTLDLPAAAALGEVLAILPEDLDNDQDTDFLVVTAGGLEVLENLRGGAFRVASADWKLPALTLAGDRARAVSLVDLDADGRPDLLAATPDGLLFARQGEQGFEAPVLLALERAAGLGRAGRYRFADLDSDGHVDLLALTDEGLAAWAGPLVARDAPLPRVLLPAAAGGTPVDFALADLDGDGATDLVQLAADGRATLLFATLPVGRRGLPLTLAGTKDNAGGRDAVVELRAGELYRRIFWDGRPTVLGAGEAEVIDALRITWPSGVIEHHLNVPVDRPLTVSQVRRQSGSCPFLYTWNGSTFEFISDVLGTAPLGLPMAPGLYVPFDHEEYVLVRGDQLVPRDGQLVLVVTEELREVTYLDRVRLHAIDHPAQVEIQPDEGFVLPPFPPHHVHALSEIVTPALATGSDGRDWSAELAAVDGRHARPFTELPWRFKGLAEPWSLELRFGATEAERAAIAAAPRLRLAATGWLQWSDASVNLAAARDPGAAFVPPLLSFPIGDAADAAAGAWSAPPRSIGFPAGKTKTLIVDVTADFNRDDPRLRLDTTLQLSWDSIRLVLDDDDAPRSDTPLEPVSATLAFRGFSAPAPDPAGELPELFDWDRLDAPRWNQHPGRYTRYGEVVELLGAADDRYVIFGAGDALELRFDTESLPPLPPGWTRDWLVYFDGWAKDRDPNSAASATVEPLPFHGMSAYPPPPGESFPDTPEHRRWKEEWNTREGAVLLPPLAPSGAQH